MLYQYSTLHFGVIIEEADHVQRNVKTLQLFNSITETITAPNAQVKIMNGKKLSI